MKTVMKENGRRFTVKVVEQKKGRTIEFGEIGKEKKKQRVNMFNLGVLISAMYFNLMAPIYSYHFHI